MENTALLTDDEVVAFCIADGRPWPLGLVTVAPTVEELTRAGARGMRSLMVRRLTDSDASKPGFRPNQMIARDIAIFLDATHLVGAYIAPADDHAELAGAAVTAGRTEDGWVVDTSTAAGVHALRAATTEEGSAAVLALAESAFNGELFADDPDAAAWVCIVRFRDNVLTITPGSLTGTVDGLDITGWQPQVIRQAFDDPIDGCGA